MRFMIIHKSNEANEAGIPPSKELIEGVRRMVGEAVQQGVLLAGDPERFLERNAKIQWGIMVCVFGLSHAPALLLLDLPRFADRGAFLLFFLVMVVAMGQIAQEIASRRVRRTGVLRQIDRHRQAGRQNGLTCTRNLGVMCDFSCKYLIREVFSSCPRALWITVWETCGQSRQVLDSASPA